MNGITSVRQPSHLQTLGMILVWILPLFAMPLIETTDAPEFLWVLLFVSWMIMAIAISARIYSQPAGKIVEYVQDIEQVHGEYRVWYMMDYLHIPVLMMVIVGAITFGEAYSLQQFFTVRVLFALIVVMVYSYLIWRVWTRVSAFQVMDDNSLWIKRGGKYEPLEIAAFAEVRGVAIKRRRMVMVTDVRFSKHVNGGRPVNIPLLAVRSQVTGTAVFPHVVENFFYKRCENAGLKLSKHRNGWIAIPKHK